MTVEGDDRRPVAYLVGIAIGAGMLITLLPSLLAQAIVVGGAWAMTLSIILVRLGQSLNPAWVIVAAVYLLGPTGAVLTEVGIGIPTLVVFALGLAPFVIAALWVHPHSHSHLALLVPLLLFGAIGVVSLLWSPELAYGSEKLTTWLFTGLLPAMYVLVLASASRRVSWGIILAAALVSSAAYLAFAMPTPEFPDQPTVLGGNPIWIARAAYIGGLVALFGPFPIWIRLAAVPILVVNGVMTQSLGPALAFLFGSLAGVAVALRCADRRDRRVALGWAGLGLGAGVTVIVLFSGALDSVLALLIDDPNVGARSAYLDLASQLFVNTPVLGSGTGGFASTGLVDGYPHNLVAEAAAELGLVGLLALLSWTLLAVRGAARSPILMALVVATGLFSLFSGSLASNTEFWVFSALAAAMVRTHHLDDDLPSSSQPSV